MDALWDFDRGRCCDGLVCRPTDFSHVCKVASPEELALGDACGVQRSPEPLVMAGTLHSNGSTYPFDQAVVSELIVGGDGCFQSLRLRLSRGAPESSDCQLELEAGPARDFDGRLVVVAARLTSREVATSPAMPCPASSENGEPLTSGSAAMPKALGSIAFTGTSCEPGLNERCYAGDFELVLQAELRRDRDSVDLFSFPSVRVTARGHACASPDPTAACR